MDINFRKFKTSLTLIVLLFYKSSFSQYNLVENPNFELGNSNNRNIYCVYTSTSDFTSDLSDWSHINVGNNSITLPHWIDLSLDSCQNLCKAVGTPIDYLIFPPVATGSGLYNLYYNNKCVLLQTKPDNKHFDKTGVIVKLKQTLKPSKVYVLRYKALPLSKLNIQGYNNGNNLRVHLRQKGGENDWDSNNNNQKLNDIGNFEKSLVQGDYSEWEQVNHEFLIPPLTDKLDYLVFVIDDGRVAIDDIELYEKCPNEIAIQDKIYQASIFHPLKEQAVDFLYAGRNVTGNWGQGDVIVKTGSDVKFTAGQKIILAPGFKTEVWAKFVAEIAPCNNSPHQRTDDLSVITNHSENSSKPLFDNNNKLDNTLFYIHPNPNTGTFTIYVQTLNEQEQLQLSVMDVYGKQLLAQQINNSVNHQIDLSAYSKGIYYVSVTGTNGFREVKKVVVN